MGSIEDLGRILPQNTYIPHLETINGISFTPREIDILTCILNGRKVKAIALFLSISPKTVETHIRNIMQKLGCTSRDRIVDYIEKSNEYTEIKKHYFNLIVRNAFELELKKISELLSQEKIACSIIHDKLTESKLDFIEQVSKHLKLASILLIEDEQVQRKSDVVKKAQFTHIHCIIYLSSSKVDGMKSGNENEKNPSAYLNKLIDKNSKAIVISLWDNDFPSSLLNEFSNAAFIQVSGRTDYYTFVFEVLKKLLPISIDKNITEFMNQRESFHNSPSEEPLDEKTLIRSGTINIDLTWRDLSKKNWIPYTIALCFIFISISIYGYIHGNKRITETARVESISTSSILGQNPNKGTVTWNLPRQDHVFVGRKELLKELHTRLAQGSTTNKNLEKEKNTHTLAITTFAGLGGIGKTQLALQYVNHSTVPYTLKAWFYAENIKQLDSQIIEFAKMLGYGDEKPSIKTALIYVKEWLSKNPGWLLVYDNVNEYEEIKPYLPESGGSVILTTRQQNWPNGFSTVNIDVMTEEESIELVKSLVQKEILPHELNVVKQLVKLLGYLPLALAQASAYIHQTQKSVTDYLDLYRHHEQTLLADKTLPPGTNSLPIAIVWNMSLDAIAKEANEKQEPSLALDLLNVCAYLAPEKIPNDLLLSWIKSAYPKLASPELILPKLISQLWRYSIIHREENGDVGVHRLVQAVVRYQHQKGLRKNDFGYQPLTLAWYDLVLKSAHAEFSRKTQILENETRQKNLLPHLQTLVHNYKELWPNNSEFNMVSIFNDIGIVLYTIGEAKLAQSYYERALPILEQHYGKDHIEVAFTLDQLGKIYVYLWDLKKAQELHERSLKIKEQYYSKDHIEVALTLDLLGRDYRYLGNPKKAQELHERSLKIKEQYYDKDHIEIAFTLDPLGSDYRFAGDYKQARVFHERALKIKEHHYGKDHIEVALTLEKVGSDYRYVGDAKRAEEFHARALKIKEKHYGKDHIEVAFAFDEMGNDYGKLADFKQAKKFHESSLKIKEHYYGKDHIEVAFTLDELGKDYRNLGDVKLAKELHERALKIYDQYYAKDYFELAVSLDELGRDYRTLGDATKARELHERALKIKEQYYGKDHVEVALTLSYLGEAHIALNNAEHGKVFLEQALNIKERYYGMSHPEVAETLIALGDAHKSLRDFSQAEIHLKRALKIREQYFGQDHSLTKEAKLAISEG